MNITVIGAGYVGLTAAACFASTEDIRIVCFDLDSSRIQQLSRGMCPIREPGLEALIRQGLASGKLSFTDQADQTVYDADLFMLAVGTPASEDGTPDLRALYHAVDTIAMRINKNATVIIKSTIPPGGTKLVQDRFAEKLICTGLCVDVIYCPEFLREGSAVSDFLSPQRIVIGGPQSVALCNIVSLYQRCCGGNVPVLITTASNAELIKYASNSFLALKVSFVNELARLCGEVGGNIDIVAQGIGLDSRIGPEYLRAGIGYGGACIPKDIRGLTILAREIGCPQLVLEQAIQSNIAHQNWLCALIRQHITCSNAIIGIWGLTFKANTGDLRNSPAISLIKKLAANQNYHFQIYDPTICTEQVELLHGIQHTCVTQAELAVKNTNLLIILVPWEELKTIPIENLPPLMSHKGIVLDLCRLYTPPPALMPQGLAYFSLGGG